MKRALAVLVMALTALLLPESPSQAARCAGDQYQPFDVRRVLLGADGAFVGTFLSFGRNTPGDPASTWRFKVAQPIKGQIPRYIDVDLGEGASITQGERVGLIVYKTDRPWWDSGQGCKVAPEALIRAAEALPSPDGSPPPILLVGGSFGEARTLALDRNGRTLAYGTGKGTVSFSVCPEGRRLIELAVERNGPASSQSLAVRDLSSFRLIKEEALPEFNRLSDKESQETIGSISCRDRAGNDVYVWIFISTPGDADVWEGRIAKVRRGVTHDLIKGTFGSVHFRPSEPIAFADSGAYEGNLYRINLVNKSVDRIANSPFRGFGSMLAVSPSGMRVAWAISGRYQGKEDRLVLFDLSTSPVGITHTPIRPQLFGGLSWADETTLTVGSMEDQSIGTSTIHVYDRSLRLKGKFGPWSAWSKPVAINGALYAFGGTDPTLFSARLPWGPSIEVRKFDWMNPSDLAAFPAGTALSPERIESSQVTGEIIEIPEPRPTFEPRPLPGRSQSAGPYTDDQEAGRKRTELIGITALILLTATFGYLLMRPSRDEVQ